MTIILRDELLRLIKEGVIKIEPFREENLGAASYDVTLGKELRVFKNLEEPVDILEIEHNPKKIFDVTEKIIIKDYYLLKPGELVLGITEEKIKLPDNICALICGRSRHARIGLMVHISAPLIHPGVYNRTVLELYNASRHIIKVRPGTRIAQLVFIKCKGHAETKSIWKYQDSLDVSAILHAMKGR